MQLDTGDIVNYCRRFLLLTWSKGLITDKADSLSYMKTKIVPSVLQAFKTCNNGSRKASSVGYGAGAAVGFLSSATVTGRMIARIRSIFAAAMVVRVLELRQEEW